MHLIRWLCSFQLWNYQTGMPVAIGNGHAGVIVTCAYSPCGRFLVTGSADGAVIMWAIPEKYWYKVETKVASDGSVPVSAKSSTSRNSCRSRGKAPEIIQQLETSRCNQDPHICECPTVDPAGQPEMDVQCVFVDGPGGQQ